MKATQLENKINYLEKNKIDIDSLKKDYKKIIRNDKLILKSWQRFSSQRDNVFTEEINKITLSSYDDKRIQSTDLMEIYACGKNKDSKWKRRD